MILNSNPCKSGILLLIVLACFFTSGAFAQAPSWLSAKSVGGISDDSPTGIAIDKNGNSYVLGCFRSPSITFGATTLTNATGSFSYIYDLFIVKYNTAGNVVWAKSAGGSGYDYGHSIAVDPGGNSYITGYYDSPTITFGGITLTNAGADDLFIAKYDSAGNVIWAKNAGGAGTDRGRGIAVDTSGNSYITGLFESPSIAFGTTTLLSAGSADIFLVKYDVAGNVVWAKKEGGMGSDEGESIALDGSGNSYVLGQYYNAPITVGTTTLPNAGLRDLVLIKYDPSGNVIWSRSAGGTESETGYYLAADAGGNCYITGFFDSPTLTFGSTTLVNAGSSDIFIAKYDSAGNTAWAKRAGGASYDFGYSVAVNGSGTSFITGLFASPTIAFGATTLTSAGGSDAFLVSYDAAGNLAWAKSMGGAQNDDGLGVTVDTAGACYIVGDFGSNSISFGPTTLTNANSGLYMDVFIAKLAACAAAPPVPGAITGSVSPCAGGPVTYSVPVVTGATSYAWTLPAGWSGTGNTRSITVTPDSGSGGTISVSAVNACGTSAAQTLAVTVLSLPAQPGVITGDTDLCPGAAVTYLVTAVAGATSYNWTLPAGWAGNAAINSINATAGTTGGNITVAAVNSCGASVAQSLHITVYPSPVVSITQSGGTLSAGSGFATYQWYANGAAVIGATSQTYMPAGGGSYYVVITGNNDCAAQSNTITLTLGIRAVAGNAAWQVYPNPVKEVLYFRSNSIEPVRIRLSDCLGRTVAELAAAPSSAQKEEQINMQYLPAGIYILEADGVAVKVVKE